MKDKVQSKKTVVEHTTSWIGSVSSLVLHTVAFAGAFILGFSGFATWEIVLLVLTTIVSLEAIYLAIFIQMTVNRNTASLKEVEEDIEEIQEDVEELGEDIDEIQEDIEEMSEEESEDAKREQEQVKHLDPWQGTKTLEDLTNDVRKVLADLEALKAKD